jgi:hypothetical protein
MIIMRRLMFVVFSLCVPGCGATSGLPVFLQPLAAGTKVTLYSIDGTGGPSEERKTKATESFHGRPVLGKVEIKSAESRSEIVQALKRSTQDLDHGGADCFWPRHGLRVEKDGETTDYVICFECYWIKVYIGGEIMNVVTKQDPQELLNRLLEEANIPITP